MHFNAFWKGIIIYLLTKHYDGFFYLDKRHENGFQFVSEHLFKTEQRLFRIIKP